LPDITAVTFDLWQTLLLDNRDLGQARALIRMEGAQNAIASFGEPYDLEHIREAYRACYRECRRIREAFLDVSFREQVEIFINNIDNGLVERLDEETIMEVVRTYADSFWVHPPVSHTDAQAVLRDVKDMGLGIGLISNTGMTPGETFRQYMDQQGLLKYFDVLTFSDEVKISKPAEEIFHMTLSSLGATPAQSVHVGDHVKNDVVGANRCGLKTVWITGFYENEDPSNPDTQPDETVDSLGQVAQAIARLTGRG
jgi:putative hydrolase of the HAD superfamily